MRKKWNIYFIIWNYFSTLISICLRFSLVVSVKRIVPTPRFESGGTGCCLGGTALYRTDSVPIGNVLVLVLHLTSIYLTAAGQNSNGIPGNYYL